MGVETMISQLKIAFGYQMRSGKDTAVEYLIRMYGGERLSFAEPLYKLMDMTQEFLGFEKKKDRLFLQLIGTEWGRSIDPNIWINQLVKKANEATSHVFVSDLRYINEAEALKANGFTIVKVVTDWENRKSRGAEENAIKHKSEIEMDNFTNWDYEIENNGTMAEFHKTVDVLVEVINSKKRS